MNPDLVTPVVTFTCATTTTDDCSIKYQIVGKCIGASGAVIVPGTAVVVDTLAVKGVKAVPVTDFVSTTGESAKLTCTDPKKRVDIKSLIISETKKANIKIDVGYQSSSASRVSMLAVASGVQYASTGSELKFGVKADGNADKTDPYIEITCLEPNLAGCSLKYEVVGECVDKSKCPALPGTPETLSIAKTVPGKGISTATIDLKKVVDATTGAALTTGCTAANTRLDIVSATFVEASGNPVKVDVSYQRALAGTITAKTFPVKSSAADGPCFAYTADDVSFASLADANPYAVSPVITLSCPSTDAGCAVKYKVVGKCVPVSTTCSALAAASFVAKPINVNDKLTVPVAETTAAGAVALGCKADAERVDIISAKISEQNGANINVKAGYQNALTKPTTAMVKSVTGVSCYQTSLATDLSFATKAGASPDKTIPSVTIECPSTDTPCSVKYEILGKCVPTSSPCPTGDTLTGFGNLAPVNGATLPIASAQFFKADKTTPFGTCDPGTRVEIVSASIVETTGSSVNINAKYQETADKLQRVVKTISDVGCYTSAGTELGFAKADENPDKIDAVVTVECLATNPGDCVMKHLIVAKCVDVSATCTADGIPTKSVTLSVDKGTPKDIPLDKILATTNVITAQDCSADTNKRLDVKSVKIIETNSASISVNVGYQKDAAHKVSVKSAADVTCFDTGAEVKLAAAVADVNPGKTIPSITVECLSAGTCEVKYEVLGECVAASTACKTIPDANTAKPIPVGKTVELTAADFVYENNSALVCDTATSRADIQSVKVIEVNGNLINTNVKYQENATSLISVKTATNVSCFEATTVTALSFASQADANYKMTNGIVAVECPSMNAGDCSIKYKVVASCVLKSAAPTSAPTPGPTSATTTAPVTPTPTTTKTTELAASVAATTTMDYYTRAIAMLVSIAAGAVMMYRRH